MSKRKPDATIVQFDEVLTDENIEAVRSYADALVWADELNLKRYPISDSEDIEEAMAKIDLADYDERQNARTGVLLKAETAINGDRNNHYGPPDQDFTRSAGILNSLGYRALGGREILPHDIAVMALAIKLSRIVWSPEKEDHWVDVAGYAGCGYECVTRESNE